MHDDFDPQDARDFELSTLAIRAGTQRTAEGEHSEAIFPTSSFVFANAADAAARFSEQTPGNIYARFTNPTVDLFARRLAALEGGNWAIATASGMSAVLATCLATLQQGDELVYSADIFGATVTLFAKYLPRYGIKTTAVSLTDLAAWQQAISPKTKLFYLETPSNPLMQIADIPQLATLARTHNIKLIVDNCFCTPILQQPLALGADLVIHSATKYLDGQGRCVGGAVVGNDPLIYKEIYGFLRTAGPTMSAFNAWVFLKGLETLPVRMKAHCEQAQHLAEWLQQQPAIKQVYYPGLPNHPQHALAKSQQRGFGGIVAFELADQTAAWTVIDHTQLFSITANLGDTRSTITHPATTTHGRLSQAERDKAGITSGLVRLSVGLEALDDLKTDLARGIKAL